MSALVYNREQAGSMLPAITIWVIALTQYAYAIPVIVLVSGIFLLRSRKARPIVFESLIALAWIFAFAWALITILVWQIARVRIIN